MSVKGVEFNSKESRKLSPEQAEVLRMLTENFETPRAISLRRKTSLSATYKTIAKLRNNDKEDNEMKSKKTFKWMGLIVSVLAVFLTLSSPAKAAPEEIVIGAVISMTGGMAANGKNSCGPMNRPLPTTIKTGAYI